MTVLKTIASDMILLIERRLDMDESSDILQVKGLRTKGYGIIPKMVMQDRRLTPSAKAIYAYFCSYAGNGKTAFPRMTKVIADLVMSKTAYYKHFNMLKDRGYIAVEQEKDKGGKFKRNLYTLQEFIPIPKKKETAKPCAEPFPNLRDTEKPSTVNLTTNINSINNNSFIINKREGEPAPGERKNTLGEFLNIQLTDAEYDRLVNDYGSDLTGYYINRLDRRIERKKITYSEHYTVLKDWIEEDKLKEKLPTQSAANPTRQSKPNRFINYPQREWDYEELERQEQALLFQSLTVSEGAESQCQNRN